MVKIVYDMKGTTHMYEMVKIEFFILRFFFFSLSKKKVQIGMKMNGISKEKWKWRVIFSI